MKPKGSRNMRKLPKMSKADRQVQEASDAATRDDYERRRRESGDWRLKNLLDQFAAEGLSVTPDVWDRLEADRRQALEDDLAWIARGRREAVKGKRGMRGERGMSVKRQKETMRGQETSRLSRPSCPSCQKGE